MRSVNIAIFCYMKFFVLIFFIPVHQHLKMYEFNFTSFASFYIRTLKKYIVISHSKTVKLTISYLNWTLEFISFIQLIDFFLAIIRCIRCLKKSSLWTLDIFKENKIKSTKSYLLLIFIKSFHVAVNNLFSYLCTIFF